RRPPRAPAGAARPGRVNRSRTPGQSAPGRRQGTAHGQSAQTSYRPRKPLSGCRAVVPVLAQQPKVGASAYSPGVKRIAQLLSARPTTPGDLRYVTRLERQPENSAYVATWPAERHLAAIRDADTVHLTFEDADSARVGYAILQDASSH